MTDRSRRLRLRQLDKALEPWRSMREPPPEGWLRTFRKALGMTLADLGRRMGSSPSAVSQLENAERQGTVTLSTLQSAADALDCELVYRLVPRRSLQAFLEREAERAARREVDRVRHTMSLEAQEISEEEIENQVEERTENLMASNWRRIWKA